MVTTKAKYRDIAIGGNPQYKDIIATIDGIEIAVPLDPANRHYAAILEWAKIDGNTIEDAD
jgi:hypothetical protein